jgi:hypothetical protein
MASSTFYLPVFRYPSISFRYGLHVIRTCSMYTRTLQRKNSGIECATDGVVRAARAVMLPASTATPGLIMTHTTRASRSSSETGTYMSSANTSAEATTASRGLQDRRVTIAASTAAGGGLLLAILVGLIVYFAMHTKNSRNHHQDRLERRQSDLSTNSIENLKTKGLSTDGKSAPEEHLST